MAAEMATMKNYRRIGTWFMDGAGLKAIAVGQMLSLLMTCTGWSSAMVVRNGMHTPQTQSFLMYASYTLVYGSLLVYTRQAIRIPWYWYLVLAVVDVESNYLGLASYQYTAITSVMLLYRWTIPCVLFLTWRFLHTRYGVNHFLGVGVCVGGLVVVISSDVHDRDRARGGSNVVLGDGLVVAAAVLYASMNVSEEFVVKKVNQVWR